MEDDRLAGKHIIVTGGATGIGRGDTHRNCGGNVSVFDLKSAVETTEAIADVGREVGSYEVDVTDRAALTEAVEDAIQARGPISGLVNSAGIQTKRPFLETSPDELLHQLRINVGGTFIASQVVASHLADHDEGVQLLILARSSELGVRIGDRHRTLPRR
ncbi:SDR family NAD(P)-dependent oxidoreductase [Halocatena marina]|uniref:SDR family NAD(P)-dependent oxidoreductase n=1 Tax=Halocatena marina TaxID=2934937 RepID=A0ABD5YUQ3_9EURY